MNENRQIFKYHDGNKTVAADPLAIQRQLLSHPDLDLEQDWQILSLLATHKPSGERTNMDREIEKNGMIAFGRLLAAARQAFKVKPFAMLEDGSEEGLTEGETMELLVSFSEWMDALGKKKEN